MTVSPSSQVLRLIQQALDEFERTSLAGSVRRAARIANLVGKSTIAIRFSLELSSTGGSRTANKADVQRLMQDPALFGSSGSDADEAMKQYLVDRSPDRGRDEVWANSVDQLEDLLATAVRDLRRPDMPQNVRDLLLKTEVQLRSLLAVLRSRVFSFLLEAEREQLFATINIGALSQRTAELEQFLGSTSPGLLDQFNVAFARMREAVDRHLDREASETLAQAVTTCRRILKAVVDTIQPVDPEHLTSDGHKLDDASYRNRLIEFLRESTQPSTYRDALEASLNSLFERFKATDDLASKGVHAAIAQNEAEFCALNTYLLATELLKLSRSA